MRCAGKRDWSGCLCRRNEFVAVLTPADAEGFEWCFGEGVGFDPGDGSVGRAFAAPGDKLVKGGLLAGSGDLDVAFGGVANPTGEVEENGLFLCGEAVVDALHDSFYEKVGCCHVPKLGKLRAGCVNPPVLGPGSLAYRCRQVIGYRWSESRIETGGVRVPPERINWERVSDWMKSNMTTSGLTPVLRCWSCKVSGPISI